jgi:tRNA threonylcarbamoyladenosine biosynthesis protein TsaB
MRVLGFDTATAATSVALRDERGGGGAVAGGLDLKARDDPPASQRPRHASRLLALVSALIEQGGGWPVVDRITVGIGPGTFTGLRIGIATAHGLARARGIELVGVSTLRSLAAAASISCGRDVGVLALIDARRGQLFAAGWAPGADPRAQPPVLAPRALAPERVCELLVELGDAPLAVGDGALLFGPMLERAGAKLAPAESALHRVDARIHCTLGAGAVVGPLEAVQPEYLRLPDAELARRATA